MQIAHALKQWRNFESPGTGRGILDTRHRMHYKIKTIALIQ